jgi:hypothetical protein
MTEEIPEVEENDDDLIPDPEPVKESEPEGYDEEVFNRKLSQISKLMEAITGGETVGARVSPVLSPRNPRTTSILSRGEIESISALLQFAKISPEETYPALDYCYDKLALNLSLDGKGIELAINLGQALTQRDSTKQYVEGPTKPTEGMK